MNDYTTHLLAVVEEEIAATKRKTNSIVGTLMPLWVTLLYGILLFSAIALTQTSSVPLIALGLGFMVLAGLPALLFRHQHDLLTRLDRLIDLRYGLKKLDSLDSSDPTFEIWKAETMQILCSAAGVKIPPPAVRVATEAKPRLTLVK